MIPNPVEPDDPVLSLRGGPCTSGCDVSPSMFVWGRPRDRLTVRIHDGRNVDWEEVAVFGGTDPLCVQTGGVMMLPPGALYLQFNGRSSLPEFEHQAWWMGLRNTEPARVRVDFESRRLELTAELCEEQGEPWGLSISTEGKIVNVPPVAVTAGRIEVPCTSKEGAEVKLDASRSFDLDGDPLLFSWWKNGVGFGNEQVRPWSGDPVATVTAPPGTTTYWVDALTDLAAGSQAPLEVVVTPNESCPARILPPGG